MIAAVNIEITLYLFPKNSLILTHKQTTFAENVFTVQQGTIYLRGSHLFYRMVVRSTLIGSWSEYLITVQISLRQIISQCRGLFVYCRWIMSKNNALRNTRSRIWHLKGQENIWKVNFFLGGVRSVKLPHCFRLILLNNSFWMIVFIVKR